MTRHEDYSSPSDAEVAEVVELIGNVNHKKIFFDELQNPRWIEPLRRQGFFSSPPQLQEDGSGRFSSDPWPQGDYLFRMTTESPGEVANILKEIVNTENIFVQRLVCRCAAKLPGILSSTLISGITKYYDGPYRRNLPSDYLIGLTDRLIESSKLKKARELLNGIFRPRQAEAPDAIGRRLAIAGINDHHMYAYTLDQLRPSIEKMGESGLNMLGSWLYEDLRLTVQLRSQTGHDVSHIWRPSISRLSSTEAWDDMTNSLIDTTFALAVVRSQRGENIEHTMNSLTRLEEPLFRRIRLETLTTVLPGVEVWDNEHMSIVRSYLLDPRHLNIEYIREYSRFAQLALQGLSIDVGQEWTELIQEAEFEGDVTPEFLETRPVIDFSPDELTRRREISRFRLLAAVGKSNLPQEAQTLYATFESRFPVPENPDLSSSVVGGFVGPSTPATNAELTALSATQLLEYLLDWQPGTKVSQRFGPSIEGLAREVQRIAASRPEKLIEFIKLDGFRRLEIRYIRAVFEGLADAITDQTFEFSSTLYQARWVASQEDNGAEIEVEFEAGDSVWRFAQRAVIRFIANLLNARDTDIIVADCVELWLVLQPLIAHLDPTVEHEQLYGGLNMDPIMLSLNTVRPNALRVSARLLDVVRVRSEDNQSTGNELRGLATEILDSLDNYLNSTDASLGMVAAYGEGFGSVINWSQDSAAAAVARFSDKALSEVAGDREVADVFFSVVLSTYRPTSLLLETLRDFILRALSSPEYVRREKTDGGRDKRSTEIKIGDHVAQVYVAGGISADDELLGLTFSTLDSNGRAEVLGRLGWLFGRGDSDLQIRERAMRLIDSRVDAIRSAEAEVQELDSFGWFVLSGAFDPDWWRPILEVATQSPGFSHTRMVALELENYCAGGPREILRVIKNMIEGAPNVWEIGDVADEAPVCVAIAIENGIQMSDPAVSELADALGRAGYTNFLDRLRDVVRMRGFDQ